MRKHFFSFLVIMIANFVLASTALAQGGLFTGWVRDDTDDLREGAVVTMELAGARPPRVEATTDEDGRFTMLGLNSGAWSLRVELEGYHPHVNMVAIRQGANSPFNITLDRIKHPLELALGEAALEGLDPAALEAELKAADEAYNTEQWDVAITSYQSLVTKLPMITALHMQIGTALRRLARYDEAIASFQRAAEGDSDLAAEVDTEVARTRMAMGDFEAASAALASAASGEDASREDLYNLGELEFAKGDMDAAAGFYEKAAASDPAWGKPPFKLALVALNRGDMEIAKKFFAQVIEVEPDSAEAATAKATLESLP